MNAENRSGARNTDETVHEYIINNIEKCVRFEPEDRDTLIGLPYPYLVPSISERYQEMYYWDTYFACEGLVLEDKTEIAKNCANDMAYLINRYGYKSDALRIAKKYNATIDDIFASTQNLWEKHNAEDGTLNAVCEYELPKMLGWTAGVYLAFEHYIKENG